VHFLFIHRPLGLRINRHMISAHALSAIFRDCVRLGLVAKKTKFSTHLLGRYRHHLRLIEQRQTHASAKTARTLRLRLTMIAEKCGPVLRHDIERLIERIDQEERVWMFLNT
jgi:hypothetical protein